jgi:hypothetical protein
MLAARRSAASIVAFVRRILAITLLFFFCMPLLTPLLAMTNRAGDDSGLPACCRRNGVHHCAMSAEQIERLTSGKHFTAVHAQCPMYPHAVTSPVHQQLAFHTTEILFTEVLTQPEQHRQIEAWARIAEAGTRHKRGPPALRLS